MSARKTRDPQAATEPGTALPTYSVQLQDVYLYEAKVERLLSEGEPAESALDVGIRWHALSDDATELRVIMGANVQLPYNDLLAVAKVDVTLLGVFASSSPMTPDSALAFSDREAFILIYPYLRSHVGEIGRMLGLPFPPLPTLDVVAARSAGQGQGQLAEGSATARPADRRRKPRARSAVSAEKSGSR